MSLRIFARNTFSTVKSNSRNLRLAAKPFAIQPAKSFSSSVIRLNADKESSHLVEVLTNEIQGELEQPEATAIPDRFTDYKGFQIANNDINSVNLHLKKTGENEDIHIFVDVDDLINNAEIKEVEEGQEEVAAEEEEIFDEFEDLSKPPVNFAIINKSKNTVLNFGINIDSEGGFSIQSITPYADPVAFLSEKPEEIFKKETTYAGPQFSNLDENLQVALLQYLNAKGLDADMIEYIEDISTHLENQKYINWLDTLQKFFK
jgi:complement component 1 Q subcomponent-binding protein, mitochondrial